MLFLVILILSFLLQMMLPWWIIIVIAFGSSALIGKTGKISFWSSFFAILILWCGMAMYKSIPNHHLLANRVAETFSLNTWWQIVAVAGVLSGLVAAISGVCGMHFRKAILALKAKN